MKKYFSPLKLKDIFALIGVIIIEFVWVSIDQIFLSQSYLRFIAFCLVLFILFYLQFSINKPVQVIHYCNSIALIIVSFVMAATLIIHVIIKNDPSLKGLLIWLISGIMPYMTGFIYMRTKKK